MSDYRNYLHSDLTQEIINAAYEVYNYWGGHGFVESVYENSLEIELKNRGFKIEKQLPINVFYKGHLVGSFRADLVVNDTIILELKAVSEIMEMHEVQLLNYLRSTKIELGLLLNFGNPKKLGIKRKIYTNEKKGNRIPNK